QDLTVANVSMEGLVNWSVTLFAGRKPVYSTYSPTIKQTTMFLYPQEAFPLPGNELGYIVIDRNGNTQQ
ncbi:MAG: hypothetical protein KI790_01560, partial [Cyclobacteriaceae bacterium]|nr:hypothetical protein [Cyclobacteriaceae bacterium HetDA_MAG_MS6]